MQNFGVRISVNTLGFNSSTKQVLNQLKKVEPETFKQLRRDMRTEIRPLITLIQQSIPATAPLSGLDGHDGRTAWTATNPRSVSIQTSTALTGRSSANILSIIENNAAVSIVDKAGMRNPPVGRGRRPENRFGENLTRRLGPSQRFGWKVLTKNRRLVLQITDNIIKKIEEATNQRIRSGSL